VRRKRGRGNVDTEVEKHQTEIAKCVISLIATANPKMVGQITHTPPPKTESDGAAPAHSRRKVRRKRGRENVAAGILKFQTEVAVSRTFL
jgi:hypothetical protein